MSGVKKLTSYFKKVTKDEREVEELLASQLSRNSNTASIESVKTLSTLSSSLWISITPPLNIDQVWMQLLLNTRVIIWRWWRRRWWGWFYWYYCRVCVWDILMNALDTVIGQTSLVFSNEQPRSHCKNLKRVSRNYNSRPGNWCMICGIL